MSAYSSHPAAKSDSRGITGVDKRRSTSLILAFGLAFSGAAHAKAGGMPETETYWKTNIVDAVIALRPCPETTICGEIVWTNPADDKAQTYFGDPNKSGAENLCGFSPRMQFEQVAPNHWRGTMEMRGQRITANIDAQLMNETTLKIRASKFIFSETDTWTRISRNDPRYPHCRP